MNKKLLSHELTCIESTLKICLEKYSVSNLENCLKAVQRARSYLGDESIQKQVSSIQNILGGGRKEKDDIGTILEEVTVAVYKIPNFDNTFIESLNSYYKRTGRLTDGQFKALENLHEKLCQRKRK
jgi:hypothetical protein